MEGYRSLIFSILKTQYGWGGCTPSRCDRKQWEDIIEDSYGNGTSSQIPAYEVAHFLADDIYLHGGTFRKRIDGLPNTRTPTDYKEIEPTRAVDSIKCSEISHVIKIKDRYFCEFGKNNRVMTAHSLTGAATYQEHDVMDVFEKLVGLGKKPVVVTIGEVVDHETLVKAFISAEMQSVKTCLEEGVTLADWLKVKETQLSLLINPTIQDDEFDSDIPF